MRFGLRHAANRLPWPEDGDEAHGEVSREPDYFLGGASGSCAIVVVVMTTRLVVMVLAIPVGSKKSELIQNQRPEKMQAG